MGPGGGAHGYAILGISDSQSICRDVYVTLALCARFTWSRARVPIFLAASGPKTLRLAGQIADGVVVRTGILPDIIRDSIAAVRRGAEEAGRDPDAVEMWWWPDANIAASRRDAVGGIKMSLAGAGNPPGRVT